MSVIQDMQCRGSGRKGGRKWRGLLPVLVVSLLAMSLTACREADVSPFRGYGAWVDTYDWSPTGSGMRNPPFTLASVDRMADAGVQTMWIQTSRGRLAADIVDRPLLERLIARARARGMKVIGWYLPGHVDEARDFRRLQAISSLDVDGIGVDIESWTLKDVPLRSRRLVSLMRRLDEAVNLPVTAITCPPLAYEDLVPQLWPNFPYKEVDQHVEAWTIMAYFTYRTPGTVLRDPHFYVTENMKRMRERLGRPDYANIHIAGGLGGATSVADVDAMRRAAVETGVMGGSLYGWRSTSQAVIQRMRLFQDVPIPPAG